jgi:hypothetical protein
LSAEAERMGSKPPAPRPERSRAALAPARIALLGIVAFSAAAGGGEAEDAAGGRYLQERSERLPLPPEARGRKIRALAVGAGGRVHLGLAGDAGDARSGDGPELWVGAHGRALFSIRGGALERSLDGERRRLAPLPDALLGASELAAAADGARAAIACTFGVFNLEGERFARDAAASAVLGPSPAPRSVALGPQDRIAIAAAGGLFEKSEGSWRRLFPGDGRRSWGFEDARAAVYDARGRLWFASPQGAGCREPDGAWRLFEGRDGLPSNDFTCIAACPDGAIWFGTRKGAIRFDGKVWEYRQGRRWLPDDEVLAIAIDGDGAAWFATSAGLGRIHRQPMTLAEKARGFEDEIDRRHRRTPYGYVGGVSLERPGETSAFRQHDSDNDGLWTAMYGAGECYAWAATRDPAARRRARAAFEALRFLGEVTQGGEHAPPKGFVARSILPADGPDPNAGGLERDRRFRDERDRRWKLIHPRWPKSGDGKWYWKCDTSSDELDGHYFFYARYHDLVASTDEEKREVRDVVIAITDHLIAQEFCLVDHDGQPTRWAQFGPRQLNHDPDWWEERGLNSMSMLSYLKVAEHVSGDVRYREIARRLIEDHAYAANVLHPKNQSGPGTGNQSDDEMAFMGFYNLLVYEKDPQLRRIYAYAFHRYWRLEAPERNPLFNFLFAAVCAEDRWVDAWGEQSLAPSGAWLEDALDTLRRFPIDLADWTLENSHRLDIVPLGDEAQRPGRPRRGRLRDGKVLPIDERFVEHWNHDPWTLDHGGDGRFLADGASFLLPYYLGLYHGYVKGGPP